MYVPLEGKVKFNVVPAPEPMGLFDKSFIIQPLQKVAGPEAVKV
jgi:hypothetical protein